MTPKRAPSVVIEQQQEVISVLNTRTGRMMLTNRVGKRILELCDGTRPVSAIVEQLLTEFPDAPRSQVGADVAEFLAQARARGVIEP